MGQVRRREFIAAIGAATVWPLTARAQQQAKSIGYISSASFADSESQLIGLRQGLKETGFVDGQNVAIEFRWAEGQYDRLPSMAADFLQRKVSIVVASGLPAALAVKATDATIPMVFVIGADPVTLGLVPSLNRPGPNITGISQFYGALGGKRLDLLREIVPAAGVIAVLSNPNNPNASLHLSDVTAAANAIGQKIEIATARNESEIDSAFATFGRVGALLVADDPFFTVRYRQIVARAAERRLPAIYYSRAFAAAGGLISYGSSTQENYRQAGVYVGRIFNGARPDDLPVLQPTKFELVINLKTAKALALTVPLTLQASADEVIE